MALLRAIEDATRGVGAIAFPRQTFFLKKIIVLECFAPESYETHHTSHTS
ncbi:MAG: hypothetical protein F6J93_40675 [Oscillatoria sp. SIO1A7]|nr:hypothetical protein [Oscillatoria sp. SIO1A7]